MMKLPLDTCHRAQLTEKTASRRNASWKFIRSPTNKVVLKTGFQVYEVELIAMSETI